MPKLGAGEVLHGRMCECTVCGEVFNSVFAFDLHRVGEIGERRCLSVKEMRRTMALNERGLWVGELMPKQTAGSFSGQRTPG